jgi:hypothetical protein
VLHVLEYLSDPGCTRRPQDSHSAEYRLLSSGSIFRAIQGDWVKSDAARFLLAQPLLLYAVSRPFDEYPLKLVLRLTVARVEHTQPGRAGISIASLFYPDAEVAQDLATLLTVLCRRLITVSGKSMERSADYMYPRFDYMPLPLATSMRKVYWPSLPASVLTSFDGQKIYNNNPEPASVDPHALTALLLGLPQVEHAESIVASARLYALALELIRERPDVAYQLLTSCVETIANEALQSFRPDDDEKVTHQQAVFKRAMELGLEKRNHET